MRILLMYGSSQILVGSVEVEVLLKDEYGCNATNTKAREDRQQSGGSHIITSSNYLSNLA